MTSTYQRILDPGNNMRGEISLEHSCDWLSYYIYHTDMDDAQNVYDDVPSDYLCQRILYYTYRHMDVPQYVTIMYL
jgi:hypothetical protein